VRPFHDFGASCGAVITEEYRLYEFLREEVDDMGMQTHVTSRAAMSDRIIRTT